MLLPRHRTGRQTWFKRHLRFRRQDWANILFAYEYRREGERCPDTCVMQHRPFGEDSIMVWGGITERDRTLLVVVTGHLTGIRYRSEIAQ
jgi:hypothetical protein